MNGNEATNVQLDPESKEKNTNPDKQEDTDMQVHSGKEEVQIDTNSA